MNEASEIAKKCLCGILDYFGEDRKYVDISTLQVFVMRAADRISELPKTNSPLPEPNGDPRILDMILESLTEGPKEIEGICVDLDTTRLDIVCIAIDHLIENRKVEVSGDKFVLVDEKESEGDDGIDFTIYHSPKDKPPKVNMYSMECEGLPTGETRPAFGISHCGGCPKTDYCKSKKKRLK